MSRSLDANIGRSLFSWTYLVIRIVQASLEFGANLYYGSWFQQLAFVDCAQSKSKVAKGKNCLQDKRDGDEIWSKTIFQFVFQTRTTHLSE
jgi:hypothetical protein